MSEEYVLHESLGYLLSAAARAQERCLETSIRKLGLTRTGCCVLLAVGQQKLSHPSDIAAYILIDRTAASRALRQLEAVGLIERQSGTQDRRKTEVKLTAKGRKTLDDAVSQARISDIAVDTLLSLEEHKEIRRLLRKVAVRQEALTDKV